MYSLKLNVRRCQQVSLYKADLFRYCALKLSIVVESWRQMLVIIISDIFIVSVVLCELIVCATVRILFSFFLSGFEPK